MFIIGTYSTLWWCHDLLALCEGNPPVMMDSPHKGPVTQALIFFMFACTNFCQRCEPPWHPCEVIIIVTFSYLNQWWPSSLMAYGITGPWSVSYGNVFTLQDDFPSSRCITFWDHSLFQRHPSIIGGKTSIQNPVPSFSNRLNRHGV